MVGQARGGFQGGACPSPMGETSPTHTSGASEDREGRWGGPPVNQRCRSRPPPLPPPWEGDPHVSRIHWSGGREMWGRGRSPPLPPLQVGEGGEGGGRSRLERRRTTMGAPIAVAAGGDGGGGEVTNPASKPGGTGKNADAMKIERAGGPSAPRRVDLSEGRFP